MAEVITWIAAFIFIAALIVLGAWFLRGYMSGSTGGGLFSSNGIFGNKPEKRLDVVEHTTIDGRRRLILIRRDNVEHLIMTGGPVDVVIETGIGSTRAPERARISGVENSSDRVSLARPPRNTAQASEG
jgi:hypothetical protein